MHCRSCGGGLPEDASFCPRCGAPQAGAPKSNLVGKAGDAGASVEEVANKPLTTVIDRDPADRLIKGVVPWIAGSIFVALLLIMIGSPGSPAKEADRLSSANTTSEAASDASRNLTDAEAEMNSLDAAPAAPALEEAAKEEDIGPSLSAAQMNARRSAQQYLEMTGFSREGLIQQLSSEYGGGYSREDAEAAVDSMDVDWNENAARSARQYLEMTGFSCNKLIEQLSSDYGSKYTIEEATYGAGAAGAC